MPPRERDGLYSQAERRLRDAVITFENGNRIEISEIRTMSVESDELDDVPIASIGAQEATFSLEGVDLNDMQDVIEEAARRQREAELQTLEASFHRLGTSARRTDYQYAFYGPWTDENFKSKYDIKFCGTSFVDSLNSIWESLGDDFELADEEEYVATDPISFDELMGGTGCDN